MVGKFPDEIVHDILFRLPPKCLIKCTSVCKLWRSIINNPSFIRAHLRRTINFNNQFGTDLLLLHCVPRAPPSSDIHNLRIDEPREHHYYLHYDNHGFEQHCKIEFAIVPKEKLHSVFLRVVGICNGLVFLADVLLCLRYTFIIFNPSIRKSVTLPKPHLTYTGGPYSACVGFGFDSVTNDYKVVRLLTDHCKNSTSFEVYSLATGSWGNPSPVVPKCKILDECSHVFVKGTLHWDAWYRTGDGEHHHFILAFDVGSELFREIIMPDAIRSGVEWQLSATGDRESIALFTYRMESSLDIWVMKEYCMEESWTKLIRISPQDPLRSLYKPLCFRKSGEVLLVFIDIEKRHELVSLDLVSKKIKNLGIHEYHKYYSADSYEESLVLLDKTGAVSY